MDLMTLAAAKKGSSGGGTLTPATTTKLGGVKVGDGLSIDNTGVLSASNSILLLGNCSINTSSDTITSSSINSNNFDAVIQSAPSGGFPTIQCTLIVNQTNTATGYNFYCVGINNPASNTYLIRMAGIINKKIYVLQVSSSSVVGINAYDISSYTLPKASTSTLGGIKVGSGLAIDNNGVLNNNYSYTLPLASADTLGGVKVGTGLAIDNDGVLSASGGSDEQVTISCEFDYNVDDGLSVYMTFIGANQQPITSFAELLTYFSAQPKLFAINFDGSFTYDNVRYNINHSGSAIAIIINSQINIIFSGISTHATVGDVTAPVLMDVTLLIEDGVETISVNYNGTEFRIVAFKSTAYDFMQIHA